MKLTFEELEARGYASVTDYCRYLVDDGNYDGVVLEVYRGDMLCLTVNDVYAASKLQPTGSGWVKYDKRRPKGSVEPRGAI